MKKTIRYLTLSALSSLMLCAILLLGSCQMPGSGSTGGTRPVTDYDWSETTLLFQMNKHSQNNELSSGCERYYAGETNKTEKIDTLVDARNDASMAKAKVYVKYSYLEDNKKEYGWGENIQTIVTQAMAGGASAPDMYCNFAYDMTCAAIKGAFANLYSTKYDSNSNGKGENYFRFTDDDYDPTIDNYFDSTAGEGYFVGYMNSLSLSPGEKAYCLASDYCTDLVRSFLVVPVNIQILNKVNVNTLPSVQDTTGDGTYGIEDFYTMVWNDENWTYDMVADISSCIAENINTDNDTDGAVSHLGDILGFAAGASSGLTSSGLLYTTDVSIIDRETLSYPKENPGLTEMATKLATLFENNKNAGVAVVSKADAEALGYSGDLEGIRQEFAKGHILFGGVIAVGSLEDSVYQNMKAKGGFGIAPVPLYTKASYTNAYRTLVHNLARIVAISVTATDTFEMCTAFLNEQSMNSSDILNEYYNVNLAKVVSGDAGTWNVKMLVYIRNHVNDCFDKTFEDVIKDYDQNGNNVAWHDYLMSLNYAAKELGTIYKSEADKKNSSFNKVKTAWSRLTD